jgi:hypothetical protein
VRQFPASDVAETHEADSTILPDGFLRNSQNDELRLHKRAISINYLLRVVLDFNSVVFVFYFNWMRVNDYCILK